MFDFDALLGHDAGVGRKHPSQEMRRSADGRVRTARRPHGHVQLLAEQIMQMPARNPLAHAFRGHIAKGEFDQGLLLKTIHQLIGAA